MISYWLDFGFSFLDPNPIAWRFPIAFQIFFCLIIIGFILEMPESPRWLILKGMWCQRHRRADNDKTSHARL